MAWISARANVIKNDATRGELLRVAAWMATPRKFASDVAGTPSHMHEAGQLLTKRYWKSLG